MFCLSVCCLVHWLSHTAYFLCRLPDCRLLEISSLAGLSRLCSHLKLEDELVWVLEPDVDCVDPAQKVGLYSSLNYKE